MSVSRRSKINLQRLDGVVRHTVSRDEAQLKDLLGTIRSIEQQIYELRQAVARPASEFVNADHISGMVADKHRKWLEQRIRQLNMKLVAAMAQREEARGRLARSVGKREAIKKLLS